MRFLRLLFWLLLALLAALFFGRNWTDVTIDLWGNVEADIKLPLLLVIAFLLGYLPTTARWRLQHWRSIRDPAGQRAASPLSSTPPAAPPVAPPAAPPAWIDEDDR